MAETNIASEWEQATPVDDKLQSDWDSAKPVPLKSSASKPDNTPEWAGRHPNLYGVMGAVKEVSRFAGETAGLIGGGMVGAASPIPGGAVIGAGLGYGAVKAGERWLEGEKATLPEAALTTAKDVGTGAAMEMGGQILGKTIGGVLEKMSKPSTSTLSKETIKERQDVAASLGITLSPAEVTGSKGLALYESMLDKSPFSTTIINTWRELRQLKPLIALREKMLTDGGKAEQVEVLGQKIKDQVNTFLAQYKSMNENQLNTLRGNVMAKLGSTETYESLGKSAQEAIAQQSKAVSDKASELYSKVSELIPEGTTIATDKLKDTAKRLLEAEMKKPSSLRNSQVLKIVQDLSGSKDALMQEIGQFPEAAQKQILDKLKEEGVSNLDWKTLQSMRSELNSRIAQADAAMKTTQPGAKFQSSPEAAAYKQLRKALDEDITAFSEESGGEIKDAFDLANAFYKKGKQVYDAPAIRRILSTNPDKVVDMVFRPKGNEIDLVRTAVGQKVFNETLKPAITKKLLGTEGTFSPKALQGNLEKYGKEVLDKVYSPQELKMISDLATNGKIAMEDTMAGHPFLKTLANERPEVVVDSILGSYERFPGSKTVLKNTLLVRSVVTKDTFNSLKQAFSDRLFKLNQITDQVQPEKLAKAVQTYENVLKIFYPAEQVNWLKQIAETGKGMATAERLASNPSGTAQNVITWGTWGALLRNPVHGAFTGIIAPKVMARLYMSEAGRRYFIEGMKTPLGTKKGTELAAKIAAITAKPLDNEQETQEAPQEAPQQPTAQTPQYPSVGERKMQ